MKPNIEELRKKYMDKTVKRAVPAKIIRQIRDMDLSHDSSLEYARDLFMFSF